MSAALEHRSDRRRLVQWGKRYPDLWIEEALGLRPWAKQREIMRAVALHQRVSVRSCHGAGKTAVAAWIVIWWLLNHRMAKVITTAPTGRQVEKILWPEVRLAASRAKRPLGLEVLTTEAHVLDGDGRRVPNWFGWGFSTDQGDAAQGVHAESGWTMAIIDEAAGVSDAGELRTAMEGVLTSGTRSRLLEIGNPTDPLSDFARNQRIPGTHVMKISAWDTPNFTGECEAITGGGYIPGLITPEWVEDKRTRWGVEDPRWISRVEAEFPELGEDVLIPKTWIDAALARKLEPSGEPRLGCDIARYGSDKSVIIKTHGGVARVVATWQFKPTTYSSGRILATLREHRMTGVTVDGDGLGSGVVDELLEAAPGLEETLLDAHGSAAATEPEEFVNRRSERFWELRKIFERGEIDIDDEELAHELTHFRYGFDSRGRIAVVQKDELRKAKNLGHSPDFADALALAYSIEPEYGPSIYVGGAGG